MTTPLTVRELAELRSTLAHENDPLVEGVANSMEEAIVMRRNGYDAVTIMQDGKMRARISNGGPPRVMWDDEGPRLLANLDAVMAYVKELEDTLRLDQAMSDVNQSYGRNKQAVAAVEEIESRRGTEWSGVKIDYTIPQK